MKPLSTNHSQPSDWSKPCHFARGAGTFSVAVPTPDGVALVEKRGHEGIQTTGNLGPYVDW
jgi:hypothetical protein